MSEINHFNIQCSWQNHTFTPGKAGVNVLQALQKEGSQNQNVCIFKISHGHISVLHSLNVRKSFRFFFVSITLQEGVWKRFTFKLGEKTKIWFYRHVGSCAGRRFKNSAGALSGNPWNVHWRPWLIEKTRRHNVTQIHPIMHLSQSMTPN